MWNGLIACWVSPFDFEEYERSEGDGAESGLQKTSTNAQNDEGDKVSAIKLDWKPLWRGALVTRNDVAAFFRHYSRRGIVRGSCASA